MVVAFLEKVFQNTFAFGEDQKEVLNITVWHLLPKVLHLIFKWIIIKKHYKNPGLWDEACVLEIALF